jgi:hypothetical protein
MRSIVFIICGGAAPNLLPITSYLLLPKNPVKNSFEVRVKRQEVKSKIPSTYMNGIFVFSSIKDEQSDFKFKSLVQLWVINLKHQLS